MNAVTVSKKILLSKLKQNRETHLEIFLEAQKGYREAAIVALDKMLDDAKSGKRFQTTIRLVAPMNQTKDYDRVIAMMEMSIDDEIRLTEHEFQMYVLDQWDWKSLFSTSNRAYSATLMSMEPDEEE